MKYLIVLLWIIRFDKKTFVKTSKGLYFKIAVSGFEILLNNLIEYLKVCIVKFLTVPMENTKLYELFMIFMVLF